MLTYTASVLLTLTGFGAALWATRRSLDALAQLHRNGVARLRRDALRATRALDAELAYYRGLR